MQQIESAVRGEGVGDHALNGVGLGDVGGLGAGDAPVGADQIDGLVGAGFVDVGDGHSGTFGRQAAGGGPPNSRACARHDGDLVLEALHAESLTQSRTRGVRCGWLLTSPLPHCEARIAATSATGSRTTGPVGVTSARTMVPLKVNGAS